MAVKEFKETREVYIIVSKNLFLTIEEDSIFLSNQGPWLRQHKT